MVARALTYLTQFLVVEMLPAISYMYSKYKVSYMQRAVFFELSADVLSVQIPDKSKLNELDTTVVSAQQLRVRNGGH